MLSGASPSGGLLKWEIGSRPPEHQADAHAGGEQHRHPAGPREFGFGVFATDAQVAEAAERQVHQEHQRQEHHQQVQPADAADEFAEDALHHGVEGTGCYAGKQHQQQDQCDGNTKHHEGASPIKGIEGASKCLQRGALSLIHI